MKQEQTIQDNRSRADLLKEIAKLKQQRSKLKMRIREMQDAGAALVYYVSGLKLNCHE